MGAPMRTRKVTIMRRSLFLLALGLLMLSGCARHYVITLSNGSRIGTRGKPHLQGGFYVFKDAMGRESYVGAGRVVEIAPASMANQAGPVFTPTPRK